MRKSVLFLSLALMTGMTATARSLSPSEALQRVTGQSVSRSAGAALASEPVMTVGSAGTPALYVFNKPEGGWMIVSADDVAAPVIGFSDSGAFDPVNIPDNFRGWLELCSEEILSASAAGAEPYARTASRADSRTPIEPLVKTRWDQGSPYNGDCPLSGGRSTYTGCVATAMAQVMKYHNWPDKAGDNASFSYTWNSQTISADFSNYEFDWVNMPDNYYYGEYTEVQSNAVAKLMQACGYSIRMRYGTDASAAYSEQVGNALVTYFRYDAGIHNEFRNYYSSSEWEEMIYDNLKNVGPMVYWGGAHCFVCDGYRPDGYFHFNWGWSGRSDGYFLLSMLKPSSLGTGGGNGDYTNNQGALLGVKPSTGTDSPRKYTFCIDELTQAYQGSYFNVYGSFVNRSPYTVTGQFVYQIYNADGTQKITSFPVIAQVPKNWGIDIVTGMTRTATQMQGKISGLADGTYRLYPAVLVDGVEYPFQSPATIAGYVLITSSNGQITKGEIPSAGDLVIENIDTHGDFFVSSDIKISGTARFTGKGDTNATVKAVLINNDEYNSIRAYSNENFTVNFTPEGAEFDFVAGWFYDKGMAVEPGDYKFGIAISENGAFKVLGSCPVTIKSRVPKPTFKSPVSVSIENAEAVDPADIRISLSVEGETGVVYRDFIVNVFQVGAMGAAVVTKTIPVYVSAGQTTTETISVSIKNATVGKRYYVTVSIDNAGKPEYVSDINTATRPQFTIGDQSGISEIEADSDAPVEYFNLQGMPVSADNLTPGVYIRRQGSKAVKILVR